MTSPSRQLPVVVIGAGAAGLMAAIFAAEGPRPVMLLEGTARPGQKILISGGGRCNVLPSAAQPEDFHTDGSPRLVRNILAAWPLAEVRRFFETELVVPLVIEADTGKLFPASNRARTVLDALLAAVRQKGVDLRLQSRIVSIANVGDSWEVRDEAGESIRAARIILATGGLSVPATGSNGVGLNMARSLGHVVVAPYPALTPLTTAAPAHKELAGVSLRASVSVPRPGGKGDLTYLDGFLFTHRGYSGPAILNVSHVPVRSTFVGGPRPAVYVCWSEQDRAAWQRELQSGRGPIAAIIKQHLPERLTQVILSELELVEATVGQLRREDRERLLAALTRYTLPWSGHEGYRVAEVTGGGVPLAEVKPATLESRVVPGLFLCGEILDSFGPIGGYNFLWAWVTGRIAGKASNS